MVSLIGCHSEHGIPFKLSAKSGNINIDGHFIWRPDDIWWPKKTGRTESITMRGCFIYSDSGKKAAILNVA
jgi:hypothetical protein